MYSIIYRLYIILCIYVIVCIVYITLYIYIYIYIYIFSLLEKGMKNILAWKIPWTEENKYIHVCACLYIYVYFVSKKAKEKCNKVV